MKEPLRDVAHLSEAYHACEIEHTYGPHIHILSDPLQLSFLSRFCTPAVRQPELSRLLRVMYTQLAMVAINTEMDRSERVVSTRMITQHPQAQHTICSISPKSKAIVIDILRGGILPAQVVFELLSDVLPPEHVRLDHVLAERAIGKDGSVEGVEISGAKIGGPIDGDFCVIPDPMAATGNTVFSTLDLYANAAEVAGSKPRRFLALHLIVTPEYLREAAKKSDRLSVYALRLDRGLSDSDVLQSTPGSRLLQERGLNAHDYVVPGAGGIGELLNNSKH